jgi:pyruvate-ferredoxin/flavodoxin oxidoreductase
MTSHDPDLANTVADHAHEHVRPPRVMMDGSEAAARVAYMASEVIAIYPITPSSGMGELADQWASEGRRNLWLNLPRVIEMQSEGGVAGALHGALMAGSLCTTFTASQGLLLMMPNMFKIAGELTPAVIHVAARSIATHALSIFGDHSDVMAVRSCGWAMLSSTNVQEAQDMAAIAHAATLECRLPFLHFTDGFRTSHEINKISLLSEAEFSALLEPGSIAAHRSRRLSPDQPTLRGTAQNPDVFFQAREAANGWYDATPWRVTSIMNRFAAITGRQYSPFEYHGDPEAERVVVLMGSGAETARVTAAVMNRDGARVGVVTVRLYRPFDAESFVRVIPSSVRAIAVLDRTKEPGAVGEPLYQDVVAAFHEVAPTRRFTIVGGRYGLSSKEFTPTMVRAVLDHLANETPLNHFTVGIVDDVTQRSIPLGGRLEVEKGETLRAIFYGLGSDGTVGANKNTIKIIGEQTALEAQAYFLYDSKKSGSVTISHLRFGPDRILAPWLIDRASFVACHQSVLLEKLDVLAGADEGATFLLNSPVPLSLLWDTLPHEVQEQIIAKQLRVYVIDALSVARQAGLGSRINTVMQACFFALSGVLPRERAIECISKAIRKSYAKRGEAVVERNIAAVQTAISHLNELTIPREVTSRRMRPAPVAAGAPGFVVDVLGEIIAGRGDLLPVSAMPIDGVFPTGTACWEKRAISDEIPDWDPDVCIQCGKCVMICPHAVIRAKLYDPAELAKAPEGFRHSKSRFVGQEDVVYTLQVSADDCTGCSLCVEVCPAKNKSHAGRKAINMVPVAPIQERERRSWDFFLRLPEFEREALDHSRVKDISLLQPLFEFSGACAGCGETPYLKLLSQLFGDRALIANATGCSSIYGGNLPTTPWTRNAEGRGPAWANSLFEDNAEFGLGMRLAVDQQRSQAIQLMNLLADRIPINLLEEVVKAPQVTEEDVARQRVRIREIRRCLAGAHNDRMTLLEPLLESLVRRSVWIVGGDGWAYDIDYGGLDHVLASGEDVNILVLDTEVYSNTGGQQSKSTPRAAVAKFAASGKRAPKKDLALLAMSYGSVYVARVAMGANDAQTVRAFREADAWRGPSLILAYSHCIAHGYDLTKGPAQQKAAVDSGHWPLLRFDPSRRPAGLNPLQLDSKAPGLPLEKYIYNEARYASLVHSAPEVAASLLEDARADLRMRWKTYENLLKVNEPAEAGTDKNGGAS